MRHDHPLWCGRTHVCSIDTPAGMHRSEPLTVDTDMGRVVATRLRTRSGDDRVEVRIVLDLPVADEDGQAWAARVVLARIRDAVARPILMPTRERVAA